MADLKNDWATADTLAASDFNTVTTQIDANTADIATNAAAIATKGTYTKPGGGIPSTDMTSAVQTSLGKADSAIQSLSGYATTAASDTAYQPKDATLTALAGVTTAANKVIYATGSDTFTTGDLTAAGRALIDDADASAQRTTLGLGNAATTDFAGLDTVGIGRAVFIAHGGTVPGGTPTYTLVIELDA